MRNLRLRFAALGFAAGVLASFASCSGSKTCDANSCGDGCCDSTGNCVKSASQSASSCGNHAASCTACSSGQVCSSGLCAANGGGGGGSATGGGSSTGGGSASGGGSATGGGSSTGGGSATGGGSSTGGGSATGGGSGTGGGGGSGGGAGTNTLCPLYWNGLMTAIDDTQDAGTNLSLSWSGFYGNPGLIDVVRGQQVTLAGPSTTHPLVQACGPDTLVSGQALADTTVTFDQLGIYGFYCPNHGFADGGGMTLEVRVLPNSSEAAVVGYVFETEQDGGYTPLPNTPVFALDGGSTVTASDGTFFLPMPPATPLMVRAVGSSSDLPEQYVVQTAGGTVEKTEFDLLPTSRLALLSAFTNITVDPTKGIVSVVFNNTDGDGGYSAAIDLPSEQPFTFNSGGLPLTNNNTTQPNAQQIVVFANTDAGIAHATITPPTGFSCTPAFGATAHEVDPGVITVIPYSCQ